MTEADYAAAASGPGADDRRDGRDDFLGFFDANIAFHEAWVEARAMASCWTSTDG